MKPTSVATFASRPFWSNFYRLYWEKKPVAFKAVAGTSRSGTVAIDAKRIFELLVKFSDRCRERDSLDGIKFYRDGVRLETFEAIEHLPMLSDKSLEGYHGRISRKFKDYGLVCDELLQVASAEDRRLLGSFMRGLYSFTGLPNRFAELGLYLGNYKLTPFGVHVDPCSVFSIPVVGQKTFRLWDPKYVEKNPVLKEAFSYEEFKKKSVVLTAGPGDVTYWPSSYWHIAESDGKFSCTWSIGVWVDRPLSDVVVETLAPLIAKALGAKGKITSLKLPASADNDLPAQLEAAAEAVSKLSKPQIQKLLLKWWSEHSSRNAFKP